MAEDTSQRRLVIFIKNPVYGRVKTRLAADLGNEQALSIYRQLLAHTRTQALACAAERLLFYSDTIDEPDEWPVAFFSKHLQQGSDLGARMAHALGQALAGGERAVLIGSDIPGLTAGILTQAFDLLDTHDFVLGPAADGGYYLIGMRQPAAAVFENITWSTPTVLQATLERIQALGGSCGLLPTLSDIDTAADWQAWQAGINEAGCDQSPPAYRD
jgi:rSAM/selenodomain-associated transferase 1